MDVPLEDYAVLNETIRLVLENRYHAELIALRLAQENPELFVKFAKQKIEDAIEFYYIKYGKIHAIKVYRTLTGSDLATSKIRVELLAELRKLNQPERRTT